MKKDFMIDDFLAYSGMAYPVLQALINQLVAQGKMPKGTYTKLTNDQVTMILWAWDKAIRRNQNLGVIIKFRSQCTGKVNALLPKEFSGIDFKNYDEVNQKLQNLADNIKAFQQPCWGRN